MNTPIIANLIPRLRETVTQHLKSYIGGEGELSSIQDSLEFWWDGIRDRDFPDLPMWSDLPAPDRDALFDAWIEAVEEFFASRGKSVSDPDPCESATNMEQFRIAHRAQVKLLREKLRHCEKALERAESAPAASCASPAPLVPEVVKEALEALETCVWSGSIGGGKEYDEEKVESALTALRSYSPVPSPSVKGNPEGLPTPQGASPPVHSDVQPVWVEMTGDRWCPECGKSGPHWHTNPIPSHSDASLPSTLSGGVEQVKASQEGSVCEVEPLGEVSDGVLRFKDCEDDLLTLVSGVYRSLTITANNSVSLERENVVSLIVHLSAWVETGSFRLVPREAESDSEDCAVCGSRRKPSPVGICQDCRNPFRPIVGAADQSLLLKEAREALRGAIMYGDTLRGFQTIGTYEWSLADSLCTKANATLSKIDAALRQSTSK